MQPTTPFRRLLEAVNNNNLDDVKAIIEQGADVVKLTDEHDMTALRYAAYYHESPSITPAPLDPEASEKNLKIIEALITAGADLDVIDKNRRTPLQLAISNANKIQAVKLLIEAGANPTGSLHQAAKNRYPDIVEVILKTGKVDVNALDGDVDTALNKALNGLNRDANGLETEAIEKVVKHLLDNGANPDLVDKDGNPALTNAVRLRNSKGPLIELLLDKNAQIDKAGEYGMTALHFAAYNGHLEVAKLLLTKGAKIDLPDNKGQTPLHYAAENGKSAVAELLLNNKAKIDLPDNKGQTPLHYAAKYGESEVVELLLNNKAGIDLPNNEGKTPLQITSEKTMNPNFNAKILITAKILLKKGADLEKIGKEHELYPLLKIIGNLADDEIKVVTKHFEDFKVISNGISMFKNFSEKESGPIQELTNDIMSMILVNSFPINLKEGLGEELTSKLVKNLLEMHSNNSNSLPSPTSPSAQSSQDAGSATEAPENPSSAMQAHKITKADEREPGRSGD